MNSRHDRCSCKPCKAQYRKGKILGSKWEFSWKHGLARVSAYVTPKHLRGGRRPQPQPE